MARVSRKQPLGNRSGKRSRKVKEEGPLQRLPDDIIVHHILSRLSTEEVVRTSILSRRWQKLWTESVGPNLIFSYTLERFFLTNLLEEPFKLRRRLKRGIRNILETYRKPTLNELIVRCDLDPESSYAINSWLKFAFSKGIARLELDLSPWHYCRFSCYTFPSIEEVSGWPALCNLRDVCLKYVNIPTGIIELLLSSCPSIERLCVWNSRLKGGKVNINGRSAKLKSVEFVWCFDLRIKISSSSLVSFRYDASDDDLRLKHNPLLSELYIGGEYCTDFFSNPLSRKFRYISQLKRLTLEDEFCRSTIYLSQVPELVHLEELNVILKTYSDACLLWPILFIKAAPYLEKFTVKLSTFPSGEPSRTFPKKKEATKKRKMLESINQAYEAQWLKVIEMHGFYGFPIELELGRHLLGITQSLQLLIVSPSSVVPSYKILMSNDKHQLIKNHKEECWKRAQPLTTFLPPAAKLKFLF